MDIKNLRSIILKDLKDKFISWFKLLFELFLIYL